MVKEGVLLDKRETKTAKLFQQHKKLTQMSDAIVGDDVCAREINWANQIPGSTSRDDRHPELSQLEM